MDAGHINLGRMDFLSVGFFYIDFMRRPFASTGSVKNILRCRAALH